MNIYLFIVFLIFFIMSFSPSNCILIFVINFDFVPLVFIYPFVQPFIQSFILSFSSSFRELFQ
jgi:hypothetical protein